MQAGTSPVDSMSADRSSMSASEALVALLLVSLNSNDSKGSDDCRSSQGRYRACSQYGTVFVLAVDACCRSAF